MPVAPSQIEEPTAAAIDAAMQEIERTEHLRIARNLVEDGTCFSCARQTLRLIQTGGRFALSCPCNFISPRPSS